jgi:hypothetical protein
MKNKGGGIILNPNSRLSPEEAFKEFLKMSDIEPLSSGGNGAIFKITIKDEYEDTYIETPIYVSVDGETLAHPILGIIAKISVTTIEEIIQSGIYKITYQDITYGLDTIHLSTLESIRQEYATQQYVFEKTCADLNSICPSPLFLIPDITGMPNIEIILRGFVFGNLDHTIEKPSHINLSLFAMEYIEEMDTLHNVLYPLVPVEPMINSDVPPPPLESKISRIIANNEYVQNMIALYMFNLCLLANDGIAHCDFHFGNGMVLLDGSNFKVLDYGRSIRIPQELQGQIYAYFNKFFTIDGSMASLQALVNAIFQANMPSFNKLHDQSQIQLKYGWFIDNLVLSAVGQKLFKLYQIHIANAEATRRTSIELIGLVRDDISLSAVSDLHQRGSIDFVKMVLLGQQIADKEERQRQFNISEQTAIRLIKKPPDGYDPDKLEPTAKKYDNNQLLLFEKLKELLFLSQNNVTQDIVNLIYTIGYLQIVKSQGTKIIYLQHQGHTIGGAAPASTSKDILKSLEITVPNKKSLDNDKKIQAKIAEIKQIQADMAKIFADWRDEVYNIFTQPDDIKNAYYQTQTPFTILTHIMVCSGLFGPLTSGKYIDVKEEENKELHDKLNLIAGAFVTMNNGYLSMSNVKMQLMIEDAKKTTITTVEKVVEGPTVEVREDIDIDKTLIGPGPGEMINREELVAGFGGNKKYSRRKRRKYSKRQRKGCRRKSNKRFYSKKVTKKRRKYSKPK